MNKVIVVSLVGILMVGVSGCCSADEAKKDDCVPLKSKFIPQKAKDAVCIKKSKVEEGKKNLMAFLSKKVEDQK